MQKLSAHRTTIYWILVVLIFFIPSVSGCGGSGGGFDNSTGFRGTERSGTSNGKALTPNVSSTPSNPIFAPGVNHTSSSPTKTLKTSSIPLPAGSTITIKSFSGDAAASNMFGYYDPVTGTEEVLTADCLASVQAGEVFGPFGPYENDVTVVFWFYSTWTSSPGKMMVEAVDSATYNIGCEDWDDDDYNDYIAQVTIEPPSKISIKNAKATPEKFNPSFNPPDNVSIITASIVAKEGFSAETISWNVVINNNNGLVKSFTDRTGSPGVGPWNVSEVWDGKNDSGVFAGAGEYTFKITATATANGETVQKSASGKVTIVDNKLKIIDASIVPSDVSPGQTVILNYKIVTYPENWEPPLRSFYAVLNTSNNILVAADLQPTSYACTAEYKDVPVTIPASAEVGVYKVQITAWTYALIDSNGYPLSAEPVELALNIGKTGGYSLKITDLKAIPIKTEFGQDVEVSVDPVHPDFYPICPSHNERLKIKGTIKIEPPPNNVPVISWKLAVKNKSGFVYTKTGSAASTNISVEEMWNGHIDNNLNNILVASGEYTITLSAFGVSDGISSPTVELPLSVKGFARYVHPYNQKDPEYNDVFINGKLSKSLNHWGCHLCSAAMILSTYGVSSLNGSIYDPRALNDYLMSHHGYTSDDIVKWKVAIDQASRASSYFLSTVVLDNKFSREAVLKETDKCLTRRDLAGIGIDMISHCSVARGMCRDAYIVQDPDGDAHFFENHREWVWNTAAVYSAEPVNYGALEIHACSFTNLPSSTKSQTKSLEFTSFNVVELCLTDHLNQMTGYDSLTQKSVINITDSSYGSYENISPFNDYNQITLNKVESTNYKLYVIGIKNGGYIVDFTFYDGNLSNKSVTLEGITSLGNVHEYNLIFDPTHIENCQAKKLLTPEGIKTCLRSAFNLNWIDNKGILNSLTKKMENADAAYKRGQTGTAINILQAFINEVEAQKGKHIASTAADILIDDANSLIQQLQK